MANGETYNMDLLVHGELASSMIMKHLEEDAGSIIESEPSLIIREQRYNNANDSIMRVRSVNYDDGQPNGFIVEIMLEKQGQSSPKSEVIINTGHSGHILFNDMNNLFAAREIARDLWLGNGSEIDPEISDMASYLLVGINDILNDPKMAYATDKKIDNYEYLADCAMQLMNNEDRPSLTILSIEYVKKLSNGDIITINKSEVLEDYMEPDDTNDTNDRPAYQISLIKHLHKTRYDYMKNMAGKRLLYVTGTEPVNWGEDLFESGVADTVLSDLYDPTPRTHDVMMLLGALNEVSL
ncbi:hypothetical protein HY003_01955 [Candidatus Saccharibacteria bacterium]|nr:hypothetical protein [Candidatus Saccharibacteria bacterium]